MGGLFDAAAMYDEDYLHFVAAPDDRSELASHGPSFLALIFRVRLPRSWPGGWPSCGRA
jgi:hypothetical protein